MPVPRNKGSDQITGAMSLCSWASRARYVRRSDRGEIPGAHATQTSLRRCRHGLDPTKTTKTAKSALTRIKGYNVQVRESAIGHLR